MASDGDNFYEKRKFQAAQVDILPLEVDQQADNDDVEQDSPHDTWQDDLPQWDENGDFSDHEFPIGPKTAKQMRSENSFDSGSQQSCPDKMRKRKFSNTSLPRPATSRGRTQTTSPALPAAMQPASLPLNLQSFVLNVVDQATLEATERHCPSPANLTNTIPGNLTSKDDSSKSTQVVKPIPLPPPLPESGLKAAGILAELISLRGSHLASDATGKSKKNGFQRLADRSLSNSIDLFPMLERFPSKSTGQNTNSFTGNSGWSATSKAPANPAKNTVTVQSSEEDDAKFLLSRLDSLNLSDHEKQENEKEDVERSHFVQELLLSMLSVDPENSTVTDNIPAELHLGNTERATPVQCPLLSKTATNSSGSSIQKTDSSFHRKDPIQPSSRSLRKSTNETNSPEFDPLHKQSNDAPSESLLHSSDQSQTFVSRQTQFGSSFGGGEKDNIDGMSPGAMPPCRMQHMYAPGSVRLAGGSGTAALSSFSRDDVSTTDVIAKHVH